MTTTELATTPHSANGALTVYDRIADPLTFINEMGKVFAHSGAGGCKTEADGKLLALACMSRQEDPFELTRRYHIMDGKLSMKATVMLAEFRERGGKHKWVQDGKDGNVAELELTDPQGNTITSRFTMQDAERAGLVRNGSGWEKVPANMLRARCISNGIDMLMPEVAAGVYTPEEIEDFRESPVTEPARTAEQVETRREELRQMQAAESADGVQDAEFTEGGTSTSEESTATEADKPVPDSSTESSSDTAVMEILALCRQMGMTQEQLEDTLRQQSPSFTTIAELSDAKCRQLAQNLKAKIDASKK